MENTYKNKIILVTGGTGTIGSELVSQLLKFNPKQIRILSRDENKQYYLMEKLNYPQNLRLLIGDIRDPDRLDMAFKGVDIVLHAAALKHVPLCEYNPFEAVKTNIIGSQNIISAAIRNNVKKVIAISTDKAANPVNIMGTSKLMMEKLFINANYYSGPHQTVFSCVRFGNVAWANGSVLPLWQKQAARDKSIKITSKDMTRFFMTKEQAANLVLKAAHLSQTGETFILKMPSTRLTDLAKMFMEKFYPREKIKVVFTGHRAGEKIHEDLFDGSDRVKTILENGEMFIIMPNLEIYKQIKEENNFNSSPTHAYPGFKKASPRNITKFSSSKNCAGREQIKKNIQSAEYGHS